MSNSYSAMGDFLQRNAYTNVWCTPNQDKQTILKPSKLTPINGVRNSVAVMWRTIKLPDNNSRFHVYHIGQVHPMLIGLSDSPSIWITAAKACNEQKLIVDIYSAKGYQIPRFDCHYMVTPEQNLIVALRVQDTEQIPIDLNTEDIFIRLYKNAFFNSDRADAVEDIIQVIGRKVQTNQDIINLQASLNAYRALPGACYCSVNGMVVDNIDLITTRPGDAAEFVYDSSIKQILTFPITNLKDFISDLDSIHKYLIHNSTDVQTIDYHDDIDFFIVKPATGVNRFKGLYYHRNNEIAVRMVTHKDYALPVPFVAAYVASVPEWNSVDDLQLIVHIRKAGYVRPLIFEANRIKDLYRMNDTDALNAMVGLNATVDVWKAASLENSDYCALMRANLGEISRRSVQTAYGYNAVSKLVGDSPLLTYVNSGVREVVIPVAFQESCTVYEYDADGLLLEWHSHANNAIYAVVNPNTRLTEIIGGTAGETLEIFRDQQTSVLNLNNNYRFYTSPIVNGISTNVWTDVTNTNVYSITGNVVTWAISLSGFNTKIISNKQHLAYAQEYLINNGIINFTLKEYRSDLSAYRTLQIPLGSLDVFINGRSLIRNLDYYINFPVIVITNKEYLKDVESRTQRVVVRHHGFCKSDITLLDPPDVGFVQYGVLSFNNRFDIRDDKVNRITVDGKLYHPSELEYGEEDFDIHVTDTRNGSPYAIQDIAVKMNSYLQAGTGSYVDPTYELRELAQQTDIAISNYLTLKIPEKEPTNQSAIVDLYKVYSPFFSRIINDLKDGILTDPVFAQQYGDQFVKTKCLPYEQWLQFDPLLDANKVDHNFVIIHPHQYTHYISLDIISYKFLTRVQKLYGGELIDLSSFVNITPF